MIRLTEREKLIRLISEAQINCDDNYGMTNSAQEADYLIANGVIVPPCNVGDTVYSYCKEFGRILAYFIDEITIMYDTDNKDGLWVYDANCIEDYDLLNGIDFYKEDIGKTVFLTYEDAERALKECEKK